MELSGKSREFLDHLRLYLVSSGKQQEDIDEIVHELQDHLFQAEQQGKSVDDVIGQSPKEYLQQISGELPLGMKDILKYSVLIVVGAFAYILLGDAIKGGIEYSLLQLIGYPFIAVFYTGVVIMSFRYIAVSGINIIRQWVLFSMIGIIPVALFVGLLVLNKAYSTPTVVFTMTWNIIAAGFAIAVFIGMAIWSKTWITIIIPALLFIPDLVLEAVDVQESTKAILSSLVVFIGMAVYLLMVWRKEKLYAGEN
ncbi:hypothetical protein Q7A53_15680 [Halobacillus rhizosphaerae]|uniref:HAAS domain-containing protein n=1 Tax=Halobacillus rhizosphaerae TaxID=3064889 RepID=UPI00398AD9E4